MISKIMDKPVWIFRLATPFLAILLIVNTVMIFADTAPKNIDHGPLKVMVLGDSLSAAYGLHPEQGWVDILAKRFAGHNIQFINASISGSTTAAGLQRFPSLLQQHHPQWVIIELGANDGLQGKPVDYIQNNLTALIEQAKGAGSQIILLGVRLPPNMGKRYTEPFFAIYAALAQKYQLTYVPFILEGVAGHSDLMQDDGLHPNPAGQKVIAESLAPVLGAAFGIAVKH